MGNDKSVEATEEQLEFIMMLASIDGALIRLRLDPKKITAKTPEADEGLINAIHFFRELLQMKKKRSKLNAILGKQRTYEEILGELASEFSSKIEAAIEVIDRFLNDEEVSTEQMMQVADAVAHLGSNFMLKVLE